MCVICNTVAETLLQSPFLAQGASALPVFLGPRPEEPLAFLNASDRGATGPNGKPSFDIPRVAAHLNREGGSWAANLGQAATITYAYRATAPDEMPDSYEGPIFAFSRFSLAQIEAAELMLDAWEDVANLTFQRVGEGTGSEASYSNAATMLFGNYSDDDGRGGFAGYPIHSEIVQGDVWINVLSDENINPQYLRYGYQTLLHEIGHAIGLSHPGDYNASNGGPITYQQDGIYYEDSRQYTVMSYFMEENTGANFLGYYASSPLLDDIAAVQRLYGANLNTRVGDTVYGFNATAGRIWFDAGTAEAPLPVIFAVWDAAGTDTLDFSGYSQDATIDLRQGHFSSVGGLIGNVSIAMGCFIENAVGGSGYDVIYGNGQNNRLEARSGGGEIYAGDGVDHLIGGTGVDHLFGGEHSDDLEGLGGDDFLHGGNGGDTYHISFNEGSDVINDQGGAGRDVLRISTDGTITAFDYRWFIPDGADLLVRIPKPGGGWLVDARIRNMGASDGEIERIELIALDGETVLDHWELEASQGSITPVGGEFRVNTSTAGDQHSPQVTGLDGGGWVIVWHSLPQDELDFGVYGQVYAASGAAIGSEFRIDPATDAREEFPLVTALTGGGFVVTRSALGDDGYSDVYSQIFDSAGQLQRSEFQVNSYLEGHQGAGPVAALADGGFVVTWGSDDQDGSAAGLFARVYGASGDPLTAEFQVNTYTYRNQFDPSLAALEGGGFVAAWSSDRQDGGVNEGVYLQVFDAAGGKLGGERRVNTETFGEQFDPQVVALDGGGFAVTWTSSWDQDGSWRGVYGQVYDSVGTPLGGEFLVNTVTAYNQDGQRIAPLSGGGFVVTWDSENLDGPGGIHAQVFDASGHRVGQEFRVHEYANDRQYGAQIVSLADGKFAVVWQSEGQDGSLAGVYARAFGSSGQQLGDEFRVNTHTANSQALYYSLHGPVGRQSANLDENSFLVTWQSAYQDGSGWGVYAQRFEVSGRGGLIGTFDGDILAGTSGGDTIHGHGGDDILDGGDGDDVLIGGLGADYLAGGAGADRFVWRAPWESSASPGSLGAVADPTLMSMTSEAAASGAFFDAVADFETGVDVLDFGFDQERVFISRSGVSSFVYFGLTDGTFAGVVQVVGTVHGSDIVSGGPGVYLYGDGTAEDLRGGRGDDVIVGFEGDDVIRGGTGSDALYGGAGADTFMFEAVTDSDFTAYDGIGDFVSGEDRLDLTALVAAGQTNIALARFGGSTFVYFGEGGAASFSGVILATGEAQGTDLILGTTLGLVFYGSDAADVLRGAAGDDLILGGAGDDTLIGSNGADSLFGSAGADVFQYLTLSHSTVSSYDVIQDFEVGIDKIDLRGVASEVFLSLFSGATFIYFDANGSGGFNGLIVAAGATLTQDDILLTGAGSPGLSPGDEAQILPPLDLDDPLILPQGLEGKAAPDETPLVLPGAGDMAPFAFAQPMDLLLPGDPRESPHGRNLTTVDCLV